MLVLSKWPSGAGMEILTRDKIARKQGQNQGYLLDRALKSGRKCSYLGGSGKSPGLNLLPEHIRPTMGPCSCLQLE